MLVEEMFSALIQALTANVGVVAIGKSGGGELLLPNESDIDFFIFCRRLPAVKQRSKVVEQLGAAITSSTIRENHDQFWGTCDYLEHMGHEIYLMYFTVAEMDAEIASALDGSRLAREGGYFYPTGRCASLLSMHILYDAAGYLAGMQDKLSVYPLALAEKITAHHLPLINDVEDFSRAIARADVLFYHFTLENAIDHFLQVLFALNRRFLPSRKRTLQYIDAFALKPENCGERLLQAVELGAKPDTLAESYAMWTSLCQDIALLFSQN
jgi:hypothetical protein